MGRPCPAGRSPARAGPHQPPAGCAAPPRRARADQVGRICPARRRSRSPPGTCAPGDDWSATLAVTGYPAEVSAGWLEPLLSYPGRVDVTLHIEPIPVAVAAARLRRQRARLESGRPMPASTGGSWMTRMSKPPPTTPATWPTGSPAARASPSSSACTSPCPPRLRGRTRRRDRRGAGAGRVPAAGHRPGHLPLAARVGHDSAGWHRPAAAAPHHGHRRARRQSFPFTSPDLPRDPAAPDALPGVLYGGNTAGPGLVAWDRWAADNHNSVTLAASSAGKYLPGQAGDPPVAVRRAPSAG